jgi:maltooligosyltrehalose trehalohydrolase
LKSSNHDTPAAHSPCGALPVSPQRTRFEVWAPRADQVEVEQVVRDGDDETVKARYGLEPDSAGVHAAELEVPVGSLYRFSIDGGMGRPDPRSRFQPFGVHGPSQVVDPHAYAWQDEDWQGVAKRDLVIYEMHLGAFSEQGTYQGAIERLPELVGLGVTAIELLPLAQTPGRWNWGYDGVNYFAPRNTFGEPDQLRQFVDACHGHSIAVINDVVYNHVGPEGNYLSEFAPYRSTRRGTPWGDAFNFDGRDSAQVRQFVIDNIAFWIDEYHFDGVRLDAVHYMFDDSEYPILDEIRDQFRQVQSRHQRELYLIGESNIYDPHLVGNPAAGDPHHDAIWSDCLMHSIYAVGAPEVRLTNRDYQATDLPEALEHAYVFSTPQASRVTPDMRDRHHPDDQRKYIESLIMALQTHDSVGNHPHGKRLHHLTSVEFHRAAAPLVLLYPSIPMIFMGEERATDSPFPFFADFEDPSLRAAVDRGRRDEYPHHDWEGSPLPSDRRAFQTALVGEGDPEMLDWYRQLLKLRREGLATGWLSVDFMSTQSDQQSHVYRLVYDYPAVEVHVVARLDQEHRGNIVLEEYHDAEVMLNSLPRQAGPEIAPRQALIWLTRK